MFLSRNTRRGGLRRGAKREWMKHEVLLTIFTFRNVCNSARRGRIATMLHHMRVGHTYWISNSNADLWIIRTSCAKISMLSFLDRGGTDDLGTSQFPPACLLVLWLGQTSMGACCSDMRQISSTAVCECRRMVRSSPIGEHFPNTPWTYKTNRQQVRVTMQDSRTDTYCLNQALRTKLCQDD